MEPIDTNPKTRFGMTKPNIFLVPASSIIYQALAMGNGADKYGPYNWRENKVSASIYIAAAYRHMMSWVDGEECASDSGVPHIGHAIACLGIIADAIESGNLIDDRPKSTNTAALLEKWTKKTPPPVDDPIEADKKVVKEKLKFHIPPNRTRRLR